MKPFLSRLGRNAAALGVAIGADLALHFVGTAPHFLGLPLTLMAAPLLNAAARWGRENVDRPIANAICKVL